MAQDTYSPEISLLFYNGSEHAFKKKQEELIDNVIQNYFIEYLKEDLKEYEAKAPLNEYVRMAPAGGLLGGEEKVGIDRLIESL